MARCLLWCLLLTCVMSHLNPSTCTAVCGVPHVPPVSAYIYNGREAIPGSLPWQVLVVTRTGWRCGGSIINKNTVITAAHCVDGPKPMDVYIVAGVHNWTWSEPSQQYFRVSEIKIHDDYRADTQTDDIAMLTLQGNITYTKYVRPVCLPQKDVPVGTVCITSGWGYVDSSEEASTVLKQTKMTISEPVGCERRLGDAYNNKLMTCTYDATSDTCQGDSGGPLVCEENGVYYLQGINSWGKPTCGHGPDAFVRVTAYLSWIDNTAGAQEVHSDQFLLMMSWSVLLYCLHR